MHGLKEKQNQLCNAILCSFMGLAINTSVISRFPIKTGLDLKIGCFCLFILLRFMFTIVAKYRHVSSCEVLRYSQINQETSKPKLAPLNEGGVSELLNKVRKDVNHMNHIYRFVVKRFCPHDHILHSFVFKIFLQEITRLQEENDKLKARLRTLESQV